MMQKASEAVNSEDDLLFISEDFSSPLAAHLLGFADDNEGLAGGDLFHFEQYPQGQSVSLTPPDDIACPTSSSTTISANATLGCHPPGGGGGGGGGSDVQFSTFFALLDASSPPPLPEQDLAHHSSSSSSSSSSSTMKPPLPPPTMFPPPQPPYVGYTMNPPIAFPMQAAGPPQNQLLSPYDAGLEAPPSGFLDGVGMTSSIYCGGDLFSGGMLAPEAGLLPPGHLSAYGHEALTRTYGSGDFQVIGGGTQHLVVGGGGGSGNPPLLSTTDMTALDDSSFKVGRLTVEERKKKIHRYMKKRNQRNFTKKIKYACRKTLADSRPRVRGRFAKNDEPGELTRLSSSSSHEFDDDDEVVVKEEDVLECSDILAEIGGVHPFKYNVALESWM